MLGFIVRKFAGDLSTPKGRGCCGMICAFCGIGINIVLFAGKLLAGVLSGSMAIVADAFNNLSDAGSSIVILVGFRLAAHKPDRDHPFGHGRYEYISGLIVSMLIILMGVELLRTGISKIVHPQSVNADPVTVGILAVSILLKLYMAFYNRKYARLIDSSAMRATAADSLSDCAATGAVLIAALLSSFTSFNIDGLAASAVSLLILYAGISSFKDTVDPLLGQAPDHQLVEKIYAIVNGFEETKGVHDLVIHDYGPGHTMVSLHVEVDGSKNIFDVHESIDAMERKISDTLDCEAVIHMDPVYTDTRQTSSMRDEITGILRENIDQRISIHDFRIVSCSTGKDLTFDTLIPEDLRGREDEIKRQAEALVNESFPGCRTVTKIDFALN